MILKREKIALQIINDLLFIDFYNNKVYYIGSKKATFDD